VRVSDARSAERHAQPAETCCQASRVLRQVTVIVPERHDVILPGDSCARRARAVGHDSHAWRCRAGRLRSSDTALRPCPRRGSRSGSPGSSRRANAGCSSRGSGRRRSCDARWRRPRGRTVPPPTSGGTRGSGSSSTSRPRQSCVPGPDDPGGGGSGGRSSGVDSGATNRPMRSCRRLYARRCGRGPGAWRHTSAPGTAGGLAATVGWAESWPVGQHASPACRGPLSRAPVASPRPGPLSRAVRRRPSSRAACRGPPSRAVRRRTRPPWPWLSPPWRAPPPASRTARPPQPSGPATRVRTAGP